MLKLVEIHFQRNKYSNLVPSLIVFGEALIIIENFEVVTKYDCKLILNNFKKTLNNTKISS